MVGDLSFPGHVGRALHGIRGILPVPGGIIRHGDGLIAAFRGHVLVSMVHAEGSPVGMLHGRFRAHDAPSPDLYPGVAGGVRDTGLPHIGSQCLGRLPSGHGARIIDIPLGNGPGHAVGKIAALFDRGFKCPSADGIARLPGHGLHGALGKLASHGTCQPSGQEGGIVYAVGAPASMEGAAVEAPAPGNVFNGGNAPCRDHQLCDHGTARMPHVDAEASHEAVDFLAYLQKGYGAQEPDEQVPGSSLLPYGFYVCLGDSKDGHGPGEEQHGCCSTG